MKRSDTTAREFSRVVTRRLVHEALQALQRDLISVTHTIRRCKVSLALAFVSRIQCHQ
jgi:hypothetical protein